MINLIDVDDVLSSTEFHELRRFIIDGCLCTRVESEWLRRVILRNDGPVGYTGYWTIKFFEKNELDFRFLQATIVLNSYYLKTLEQMKRTLAHEYGHHWTLGYMIKDLSIPQNERAEKEYYRMRGLSPVSSFAPDYSLSWYHCDKEILAEDYKYHFSPYAEHRMKDQIGLPSLEVKCYIWDIGLSRRRSWDRRLESHFSGLG